ncbi:MAG: UDP-N-acetylgalactosamine-undecaprenyl-phosphate N-acetylgalactosaminephosphotransferase [Syntrophorhabdus sp. PtaU1.Bin153]|nr:MAG: UDP-N-acetylgalactosamine-undecaprenyl-phosphate N-acetylgalactosaminephosphotransferase [Syntrophorhabdus sp. PtaU1.Bin153]
MKINPRLRNNGHSGGGLTSLSIRHFAHNKPRPLAAVSRERGSSGQSGGVLLGTPVYGWILLIGDLALIVLAGFLSGLVRFGYPVNMLVEYTIASTITLIIYPSVFYIFDLYNVGRFFRSRKTAFRSGLAVALGGSCAMLLFYAVPFGQYGRGIMAIQMVFVWGLLNLWRWAFGFFFQNAVPKIPTLILGAGYCGSTIYELLKSPLSPYEVKGFLDDDPAKLGRRKSSVVMGTCHQLGEIAREVGASTAILAIPNNRSKELIRNILNARLQGIDIRDMADVYEQLTGRIPVRNIGDQWLLFADGFYLLRKEYIQKLKRLMDFAVSGLLLVLTAPTMALIAIAIRMESPGPVFYRQVRVGKDGKPFTIYKFRSMRQDSEAGGAQWAAVHDPRATRIGRVLRLSHLDELPQMWNIFNGDMSIVGPRPERPEFVKTLEEQIPYYAIRHSIRPGVTGWAQVNYRYGSSVEDSERKLEHDLYYVKNMSLLLDFKILLRTIGVVLLGDGSR